MPADAVQLDAGQDRRVAAVEHHALLIDGADHVTDVLDLVGGAHESVAHCAAGGEGHLAVLQVEAGVRELVQVAGVVGAPSSSWRMSPWASPP